MGNDMTMEDGKMVEIPTGEDAIDSMEGQRTKGKLCETTEMRWRMDQYKGVRMHKAKGKHTSGTQKVGDIPGSMNREEARIICGQMNGIRELIDEEYKVRTCDVCKMQGKTEVKDKQELKRKEQETQEKIIKKMRRGETGIGKKRTRNAGKDY